MADYQRILSYLYRYEKNEKRECKGFVKAEQRRSGLKLTMQINDDRLMEDMKLAIYFYGKGDLASPAKWPLHYFDEITSSAHQEETVLFYSPERLPAGFEIQKQHGVLFYYQDSFYYGSVWIGEELPAGVLIGIRNQSQEKEKEGNSEEEPSKEKSSKKDISGEEASQQEKHKEIILGESAVIRDGDLRKREKEVKEERNKEGNKEVHNKKEEFVLEKNRGNSLENAKKEEEDENADENPDGKNRIGDTGKTEKFGYDQNQAAKIKSDSKGNVSSNSPYKVAVKIQNSETENRKGYSINPDSRIKEKKAENPAEENSVDIKKELKNQAIQLEAGIGARELHAPTAGLSTKKQDLLEEMWIKLHKKAPEVDNIFNKAFRKGYRISVDQLRAFSVEAERLGGNQFLLKGYGHYHHLLAGKVMYGGEERYCVGVPGIYENREKYMAEIYRFPVFLSLTENRIKTGGFGYWLHLLP